MTTSDFAKLMSLYMFAPYYEMMSPESMSTNDEAKNLLRDTTNNRLKEGKLSGVYQEWSC